MTIVTVRTFDGMSPKRASRRQAEPSAQVADWTRLDNKQLRAWHEPVRIAGQCPPWTWEYPGGGGVGTGGTAPTPPLVPEGVLNYASDSCNYGYVPTRTPGDMPPGVAAILVADTILSPGNTTPWLKFAYLSESGTELDSIVMPGYRPSRRVFDYGQYVFVFGGGYINNDFPGEVGYTVIPIVRLNKLTKAVDVPYYWSSRNSSWSNSAIGTPFYLGASKRYVVFPGIFQLDGGPYLTSNSLYYAGTHYIHGTPYTNLYVTTEMFYQVFDLAVSQIIETKVAGIGDGQGYSAVADAGDYWGLNSGLLMLFKLTPTTYPANPTISAATNYYDAIESNNPFGGAISFRNVHQINHFNGHTLVWGVAHSGFDRKWFVAKINPSTNALESFNWNVFDRLLQDNTPEHPVYWNGKVYVIGYTDPVGNYYTKVKVQGYNLSTGVIDFVYEIPGTYPALLAASAQGQGSYTAVVGDTGIMYVNYISGTAANPGFDNTELWTTVPVQLG